MHMKCFICQGSIFSFRVDPFQKGGKGNFDGVASPERESIPFKWVNLPDICRLILEFNA